MVNQPCSYPGCTYETGEIADINLLIEVLKLHGISHSNAAAGQAGDTAESSQDRAPQGLQWLLGRDLELVPGKMVHVQAWYNPHCRRDGTATLPVLRRAGKCYSQD